MRYKLYKDFSLDVHDKINSFDKPSTCQLELTFRCPLRCRHCYAACYNNPACAKKELPTGQIIRILDNLYNAGVLWLCFTGGDPLARNDFLRIYEYAKKKGFIITVFTSGALLTCKAADFFADQRPFCIELTLNAVTKKTFENISNVKGSFEKVISAVYSLKKRNIPFKIKTQVTRLNVHELEKIKGFVEALGLEFFPDTIINPGLNGDLGLLKFRLSPKQVIGINVKLRGLPMRDNCTPRPTQLPRRKEGLFPCPVVRDVIHIDPYGNLIFCPTLRKPSINILDTKLMRALRLSSKRILSKTDDSRCSRCSIWYLCNQCPGRASLEKRDERGIIGYYCRLAHLAAEKEKINTHAFN